MVWNLDPTSPADDDVVSQYPPNERSERLNTAGALGTEHDIASGHHQIPYLTTAARDGITDWVQGSIIYNTTTLQAEYQENASAPFSWIAYGAAESPTPVVVGLTTSTNSITPNDDIDIAPGSCWSEDLTEFMEQGVSPLVKQMDSAWAVGTNQGGLDATPRQADSLYAHWLIKRKDTGVVDAIGSLSFTNPAMPANYDTKRLIGAFATLSGPTRNIAFLQIGDYFRFMGDVVRDISDGAMVSNVFKIGAVSVPPNCLGHIYGYLANPTSGASTNGSLYIRTNGAADEVGASEEAWVSFENTAGAPTRAGAAGFVLVDSSRQIQYAATESDGSATVSVRTLGFNMLTRSNP